MALVLTKLRCLVVALLLLLLKLACDFKINDLGWFRPIGCFRNHYVTIAVCMGFYSTHRCLGHSLIEALTDIYTIE